MTKRCACEGLRILEQLIDYYDKLEALRSQDPFARLTPELKEQAIRVSEQILHRISDEDISNVGPYSFMTASVKEWLRDAQRLLQDCKAGRTSWEGYKEPCAFAIEYVRSAIHSNWGLRQALVCGPKLTSKEELSEHVVSIGDLLWIARQENGPKKAKDYLVKYMENLTCTKE